MKSIRDAGASPRFLITVLVVIGGACPTTALSRDSTWWHGTYASRADSCAESGSGITYSRNVVTGSAARCTILQQVDIRDLAGVLLDLKCTAPEAPDKSYPDRQLLLALDDGTMLLYPPVQQLWPCAE